MPAGSALALEALEAPVKPGELTAGVDQALLALARDTDLVAPLEGRALLTPHAGELASMTGESKEAIEKEQADRARKAARRFRACVALKASVPWHSRQALQ